MGKYTERVSTTFSEEQYRRIEKRANEGGYSSKAEYVRSMVEAGESDISALDPRTSDTDTDTHANHKTAEAAAKALSDSALIDQLDQGEANKQGYEESIQELRQAFENTLIDRLGELSSDPSSPVQNDNRGSYYLEEDA